jgi:two-component system NtrC family sensor kinase
LGEVARTVESEMNQSPYAKMKRIILLIMIAAPAVPFFLVLIIGYHYFTGSLEAGTMAMMSRVVGDHRRIIDTFLSERKADLEFILSSYTFEELSDEQRLYEIFLRLREQSGAFVDLGLFNEDGIHLVYHGPYRLSGRDYTQEVWFQKVLKEGSYISDMFLGFRGIPHFVIALKRPGLNGSWILRATVDPYVFNDIVKSIRIGKSGEAYIVNLDGALQTERRSSGRLMEKAPDPLQLPPASGEASVSIRKDASGEECLYATAFLNNKQWLLVVRQQTADAFRALRSASYLILLILVIGGTVIVAAALFLSDWVVRRMEKTDQARAQLSGQLIRATRLAELGQMAAGFAHEINNPLQIIKSEQAMIDSIYSGLRKQGKLEESEEINDLEDSMQQIKIQVERCAKITKAILGFGRQSDSAPKDIELSWFIPEVLSLVEKKADSNHIRLAQDILPHTPPIHVDPSQLQQVLINLLNNAVDAIVDRHGPEGGELSIQARPAPGAKVEISVTDNGVGISPENMKRVFAPFFTTKPVGKGTGLGLSVCYGIVDGMGGKMEVSSQEGVGTTFRIQLSAAPAGSS